MSNIRFRRFEIEKEGDWELDCFVLPNDDIAGELINYNTNSVVEFSGQNISGLFASLDCLLNRLTVQGLGLTPKSQVRLVIGRLRNQQRSYYSFRALGEYEAGSTEAEIWRLVNGVFEEVERRVGNRGN